MTNAISSMRRGLFGFVAVILAFGPGDTVDAQPVTKKAVLEEMSRRFKQQLQARRPPLYYELLRSDRLPQRLLNENPDIQLMYINERGHPVFYGVDNLDAAKTISTDDVWPGGSGGFSLTGSGTALGELGIWDAGAVLTTHQEFGGRVEQMDYPGATHYHATHVAGTMVAAGVDPAATGMSFEGTLAAYDWEFDIAEMASAAASGMNISNHSYGYAAGWWWAGEVWYWLGDITISATEDYGFGFYDPDAQALDSIACNAPYYTIVKSAGNDRGQYNELYYLGYYVWDPDSGDWVESYVDRDPDGGADGYDCIPWEGTAKNIITVGAVHDIPGGYSDPSDVVMTYFSSWGPTDDGRIKPDVVANGISLYSCTNESNMSYDSFNGTSMSSPNLSGSLNLLVRHFEETHGVTPLSSTMKAIVIQTADEAGPNPGPDYRFGWGLMNTAKAAELIEADAQEPGLIVEGSLGDGETDEYCFYSDGISPIRTTMVWTDPPGTPPPPSLNPTTLMLVNDLDMRLEHVATSTVYYPVILDPDNPASPANTGDNVRDNVEQIHLASPAAGDYRVTVSHKGTLATTQHYSIVLGHSETPIVFTSPAQNELNVPVSADISVAFNVHMNEATINNSTFVVHALSTGFHEGTISYNGLTRTATFDPVENFDEGEVVTVVLTTEIQSFEGPFLDRSYVWSFTTGVDDGAGTFAPHVDYRVGEPPISFEPSSVFSADFDGDGDLDLATANLGSDDVSVLLNNGNGTFAAPATYPVSGGLYSNPYDIVAGDFDADGDLDLATGNWESDNVSVLLNNGEGDFIFDSVYSVGEKPSSVFAADFDGDGDLDLATANVGSDDVSILFNVNAPVSATMSIDVTEVVIPFVSDSDTFATMVFSSEELDSVTIWAYTDELPPNIPEESDWVHRYYSIVPFPEDGDFETILTLFYRQTEFDVSGLSDESELGLCRYDDLDSTWAFNSGIVDTGGNSVTLTGVTEFSLWAITDEDNAVGVFASDKENKLPKVFSLSQNYPNPFNPITEIKYALPKDCQVKLEIYNILGQRVATLVDEKQQAGYKTISWNASSFASGIYFYRLQAGDFVETRKMILLR